MGNYQEIKSINTQEPASKNQITNNKPDIIKNTNVLNGYVASSMNGGHIRPIAYAPIMAGQKVLQHRLRANIKMITPKTPVYQKLKAVIKTYFVPNSRVWDESEKFYSQKGGATETKIEEMPNFGGINIPFAVITRAGENDEYRIMTDTDIWRDSWLSTYIPRYQTGLSTLAGIHTLPKAQGLGIRGFKALWNDYERNKEYDTPFTEYKQTEFIPQEILDVIPNSSTRYKKGIIRGKRQNSYYTDYRTQLLGEDTEIPQEQAGQQPLLQITEWEKTVSELRSQAENAQLNDWDIMAKLYGARKLTEGKVQLLGTNVVGLNYQAVTQSAYNTNEEITTEFQELGTQGAYSYTEIDIPLYQLHEFIEPGYIHIVMQVTSDSVFECSFDRMDLNVNWKDQYRPDLKDLKEDVLYEIEKCATRLMNTEELTKITGYKRKFSEYFKLPNIIQGDFMTAGYYISDVNTVDQYIRKNDLDEPTRTNSKRSFQFFEQDDKETAVFMPKKIWKDYTDILINENQATMQEVQEVIGENEEVEELRIVGDNQILLLGMQIMATDMPIDENIKNNYTMWGEK